MVRNAETPPAALAPHESLELHEAINLATLNLAKSKLLQGLVFDQELKALLQRDVETTGQWLAELRTLYAKAPFRTEVPISRPTPILEGETSTR